MYSATLLKCKQFCVIGAMFLVFLLSLLIYAAGLPVSTAHSAPACIDPAPLPVAGTPVVASYPDNTVWLNELLPDPKIQWNCSSGSGAPNDWVELYNPQNQSLDLSAAHTEISLDGGTNWYVLPFGSVITARGFLVVFPPASAGMRDVILMLNGTTVDRVTVPEILDDQSYARMPDGTGAWQLVTNPTIDKSNGTMLPTATPDATSKTQPVATQRPTPTSRSATPTSMTAPSPSIFPNQGTPPAWNHLQFPTAVPTATRAPSLLLAQARNRPPPTDTGWPVWLIVGLIIVGAALLGGVMRICLTARTP